MGKGKLKDAGNEVRTRWKDPTKLKAFCDLCATQVLDGKRSGGYLRKEGVDAWKTWKEVYKCEIGLGYDLVTGKIEANDEWWTRKLEACPNASIFKNKGLPNVESMKIMFEGTVAMGKNAFCTNGEIPKECIKGSGDSTNSKELVDPQCQPSANVDLMEGICKKPRKKHSVVQEMPDSLKNISDVIVESRSVSTRTPFASIVATKVQAVIDIALTLPGVQLGDRLHMFSTCFFMGNQEARYMFATQRHQKEIQLKWLEMQYQMNPQFHF
ncbi:uncharacterized protein LOC126728301 [Quercus robur]|uniref:uncharacterized protein LOC126728301 n=1 Tax=Quercus robur TaxID=38942 RepID=UPI002161C896|nr:uncharacterized protein LOC126728301 [Quercus robur]